MGEQRDDDVPEDDDQADEPVEDTRRRPRGPRTPPRRSLDTWGNSGP